MSTHIQIQGITPRIQYVADGSLTTYSFPFAIFKAVDLKVYLNDTLQASSAYSVNINEQTSAGSVTFNSAPASGITVTLMRDLTIARTTDFQEGSPLRADVLNDELDFQIACQQQIADTLNRSMALPAYAVDTNINLTLPLPEAGKAIVWNNAGNNLENSTVAVNALESTLAEYKNTASQASQTATAKAQIATTQAEIATQKAQIATDKATEAVTTLANKAEKDFSNVTEDNARQLIGNRVWISGEYSLSNSAQVVITHNLGLTDITKAVAIPYLKFTSADAEYSIGDIVSNFALCGAWYTPSNNLTAITSYGPFLNLTTNTVIIPKLVNASGIAIFKKNAGTPAQLSINNVKVFIKIIY